LFALAAFVVISAAWSLSTRRFAEFSVPGLLVALLAIPIMYGLANCKIAIAKEIGRAHYVPMRSHRSPADGCLS